MKQVLKMEYKVGQVVVEYHEGKMNPYRIYVKAWVMGDDGIAHQQKKQVAKYAELKSCLYHIAQCI